MKSLIYVTFLLITFTGTAISQKYEPIKPGMYAADPQTRAKQADMRCPIKGQYQIRYKAVGGMVIDKDVTTYSGEYRYCKTDDDLKFCNANNPTPNIKCQLLDPLIPRGALGDYCSLTSDTFVDSNKHVGIPGGWSLLDKKISIHQTVFTCRRAFAMDSCRYWFQSSAFTLFKNQGLFSVDRVITGDMSACSLDESAEAAYQAEVGKSRQTLTGLLDIKKKYWLGKCPANNATCAQQVTSVWTKAAMDGHGRLATYPFNGNAFDMMMYVTKTYDSAVDKEVAKYPKISNFPKPS